MSFFATLSEDGSYQLTQAGYTVIFLAIIALVLVSCFITKADQKLKLGTRKLVFSAMAIALAVVTSFLKLFHLPMGGSITLFSMLFVVLIGYWYGLRTGIMAAVAYGLLQLIIDPYILTIPQMLTDYVFAFGALGLSGLFSNAKHGLIKGYIAACSDAISSHFSPATSSSEPMRPITTCPPWSIHWSTTASISLRKQVLR